MCISKTGKDALTHFKEIKTKANYTLVKCQIETGRKHQIRVHFSHLGAPLLGDTLYGGNCEKINRQALHCKTIYFTHPITHEKITVDSDFPKDFKGLI